jgi:hypothetical protein
MKLHTTITETVDLNQAANEIIESFYFDYHLEDSQYYLWKLFQLSFSGNLKGASRKERHHIALFYNQLNDFLTALYHQQARIKP